MISRCGEVREGRGRNKAKKSEFLFSCHLLKRQEDSASYMERPRVVDDDDWIDMGRMDYQLQEERGLANPAPATMARGG